jgi:hypothetical protein
MGVIGIWTADSGHLQATIRVAASVTNPPSLELGMKLARIILAAAALLSAAACSSDRITSPARPAVPSSIHASIAPSGGTITGGTTNSTGTPLEVCVTSTVVVNGISTIVTTCDNGQLGSGQ